MTEKINILQISDLHFVIHESKAIKAEPHDPIKQREFIKILDNLNKEGKPFDLCIATGDLTTDGDLSTLEKAYHFFTTRDVPVRGGPAPGERHGPGLNIPEEKFIVLPGNHDRFMGKKRVKQRENTDFEYTFYRKTTEFMYPYVVGYRKPDKINDRDALTLLFFVFDSTARRHAGFNLLTGVARGFVSDNDINYLHYKTEDITNNSDAEYGNVEDMNGNTLEFKLSNSIRIALLHHHPLTKDAKKEVVERTKNRFDKLKEEIKGRFKMKMTSMKNAQRFVDACTANGINLVLFGHDHIPFMTKEGDGSSIDTPFGKHYFTYFICCPSTLEIKSWNGFYLIEISESKATLTHYGCPEYPSTWKKFGDRIKRVWKRKNLSEVERGKFEIECKEEKIPFTPDST